MNFNEYQRRAQETAIYPAEIEKALDGLQNNPARHVGLTMLLRLNYVATGLAGEAGEFCNKVKKVIRDTGGFLHGPQQEALALELGDALWYLSEASRQIGYSLDDIADMNLDRLAGRKSAGRLKGSGDDR